MRLREFHGELKYEFDSSDIEDLLREEIGLPALAAYMRVGYTFTKFGDDPAAPLSLDKIEVVLTSWDGSDAETETEKGDS